MAALSGAVLAGGNSRRMGRDKATLPFRGEPLWQHQLGILRAAGASDIFISASPTVPYAATCGVTIVPDAVAGGGPMAGLAAALAHAQHAHVIILAIDLPLMPASFLRRLGSIALHETRGVIPRRDDIFEPLAAVYPRAALAQIENQLRAEDRSLQRLARRLIENDLAISLQISASEERYFSNVNTPEDLARLER